MKMFCGSKKKKFDWRIKRKNPETIFNGECIQFVLLMKNLKNKEDK
jgi:hypothetical protein